MSPTIAPHRAALLVADARRHGIARYQFSLTAGSHRCLAYWTPARTIVVAEVEP